MTLGEVCEHGSLKRQCVPCELIENMKTLECTVQAADELAKAMYQIVRITEPYHRLEMIYEVESVACEALAAYEKARGLK